MTIEEAEALLGPEVCARIETEASNRPPFPEQLAEQLIHLINQPAPAQSVRAA